MLRERPVADWGGGGLGTPCRLDGARGTKDKNRVKKGSGPEELMGAGERWQQGRGSGSLAFTELHP